MDEIIKNLIIENRLTLTLLAMFFTPVGLFAGWRYLLRDTGHRAELASDVEHRLATIELTLSALVSEVAQMTEQQGRVASALEHERLVGQRPSSVRRAVTPV